MGKIENIEELDRLQDSDFQEKLLGDIPYGMSPLELQQIKELSTHRGFIALKKLMKKKMENVGRGILKDGLKAVRSNGDSEIMVEGIYIALGKYEGLNIVFKQPEWANQILLKLKKKKSEKD